MPNELNNYRLYYLIWMGNPTSLIVKCKPYQGFTPSDRTRTMEVLRKYIDVDTWFLDFSETYRAWMDEDDTEIYNINAPINTSMMAAIAQANTELAAEGLMLFYWFNKDVTELDEEWEWKTDPIDNNPLTDLGPEYYDKSRLVCEKHFLVFPHNDA
ncbi:hypothetical protein [Flavipsychrobacter stenotrophus]|nr:hypothetical protein [Flavipsychrobacter stenotrophus]